MLKLNLLILKKIKIYNIIRFKNFLRNLEDFNGRIENPYIYIYALSIILSLFLPGRYLENERPLAN